MQIEMQMHALLALYRNIDHNMRARSEHQKNKVNVLRLFKQFN